MPNTENILAIRKFNRFYTKHLGLLHRQLMGTSYSLIEARVLYELAQVDTTMASAIQTELGLDQGYLSRILKRFEKNGILSKDTCPDDGRISRLRLTQKGKDEALMMVNLSNTDIRKKLEQVTETETTTMVHAMQTVEQALNGGHPPAHTALIRSHRAGDIGWVIQQHGLLYTNEYGFNENFEALCAKIASSFLNDYDAKREHCWIAELDGENVGCVFLVKEKNDTAKLRLLLVDPKARGLGLGKKLVHECISFARRAGYKKMVLWTNDGLDKARGIYEAAGFQLLSEETHYDFGPKQVGQHWQLDF